VILLYQLIVSLFGIWSMTLDLEDFIGTGIFVAWPAVEICRRGVAEVGVVLGRDDSGERREETAFGAQ